MTLFERIRSLAAKGYGAEDISVMLDLKGEFNIRNIRNIVFGDFDVSTQTTRGSGSPAQNSDPATSSPEANGRLRDRS